jgi:hypothetical protein
MVTRERTASADYEINKDVYDSEIREDFILMSQMHDDMVRYESLSAHMTAIDSRINYLTHEIGSMKRTDPNDRSNNSKITELEAMRIARLQYHTRGNHSKK